MLLPPSRTSANVSLLVFFQQQAEDALCHQTADRRASKQPEDLQGEQQDQATAGEPGSSAGPGPRTSPGPGPLSPSPEAVDTETRGLV